jgi:hypothetical protein
VNSYATAEAIPASGDDGTEATARTNSTLRHVPVFFMFSSFLNMVLCLSFIFFAPAHLIFPLCTASYALLAAAELFIGVRSPVTLSLLAIYFGLACLADFVPEVALYTQYMGALIFGWLSLLVGGLLLAGKPFTSFYGKGRGLASLQRATSLVWLVAHVASFTASLYFMPDELFIFVPCAICVLAGLVTIALNLVWFGPAHAREEQFSVGPIEARQLRIGTSEFDGFCEFFTRHSAADHGSKNDEELKGWTEIMRATEADLAKRSVAIGAFEGGRLVGSIRCVLDRRGHALPMEEQLNTSFDGLRKHGRLLYVGRVAIEEAYRQRPEVMASLFKAMVDVALQNDVAFLVVTTFTNRVPTFMKLGFEPLFSRNDPRYLYREPFGIAVVPLVMNLSRLGMSGDYQKGPHQHFSGQLNPYLQERWYKRMVLRHLWRARAQRPWECDLATVRAAAVVAGPVHAQA